MKINKITGILIDVLIFTGIVCILCIPLLLKVAIPYYSGVIYYSYMAFLFISGIFTIYILYNIRRMYKTLFLGNPFVKENIKYFLTHSKTFLTDIQYNLMIDGVLGIVLIAEIYVIYASFV